MTATLRQLQQATFRADRHLRQVHGIAPAGSASQVEAAHQRAHRDEGTAWHPAWHLDDLDDLDDEETNR